MVGIRIAQLRQDRGFKQADLADLLHISASAVGMYEQGRRLPSLNTVIEYVAVVVHPWPGKLYSCVAGN